MMRDKTFAAAAILFALAGAARADGTAPAPGLVAPLELHYAPAENLERVDVAVLDRATRSIDMAAFVLTDYPVIAALGRAAGRGVAVRILLDRGGGALRVHLRPRLR